jgi:hypothetical protein
MVEFNKQQAQQKTKQNMIDKQNCRLDFHKLSKFLTDTDKAKAF